MTNYQKGAAFEREVKADLIAKGWCAVRSAGSHGEIDVLAHHKQFALYVQCKKDGVLPTAERKELMRLAEKHGASAILADKRERGFIAYTFLGRNGDRPFEPEGIGEYG